MRPVASYEARRYLQYPLHEIPGAFGIYLANEPPRIVQELKKEIPVVTKFFPEAI